MNQKLGSKEGLIFLSYLTKCQVGAVYYILENYGEMTIDELSYVYDLNSDNFNKIKNNSKSFMKHHYDSYYDMQICMEQLEYYNVRAIAHYEDEYPAGLKHLGDPPPVIYVKGQLNNNLPMAAVVGTREMSNLGHRKTSFVVDLLNESQFGIVSGLAMGIDTTAHLQSLKNGWYTIAVLAQPLNKIFPEENYTLANRILKSGGALISELPFGVSRGKADFPLRNRIQAALSEIVIPIEMETKSGTMYTVDYAKRLNRLLFLIAPNKQELDFRQYEGITYLIDKQNSKPNNNTFVIQNSEEFKALLRKYRMDGFFNPPRTLF